MNKHFYPEKGEFITIRYDWPITFVCHDCGLSFKIKIKNVTKNSFQIAVRADKRKTNMERKKLGRDYLSLLALSMKMPELPGDSNCKKCGRRGTVPIRYYLCDLHAKKKMKARKA